MKNVCAIKNIRKTLLFALALLFNQCIDGQIITTIAGGSRGFSGDGGPATAAATHYPHRVFVDGMGNIYISDSYNYCIRKVNTSGVISTIAGIGGYEGFSGDGGPATDATLDVTDGFTIDASGNMYIVDCGNNRIRKVNTSGIISTIVGTGSAGFSGDGGPATAAEISSPYDVVVDRAGNLLIAEAGNSVVRRVNTSGIISTIAGNGTSGYSGDGGPATAAEFAGVGSICYDTSGNLYIADQGNNCIRKVNTAGIVSNFAGNGTAGYTGDGGPATGATLNLPRSVATDLFGDIYIAEENNNVVRQVNPAGIIRTFAGNSTAGYSGDGGPATAAELSLPFGVGTDAQGNVYIADNTDYAVRKVTCSPITMGSINGEEYSACAGAIMALSDTAAGGTWSSSSATIATVSSSGSVSTLTAGTDTIFYAKTNGCFVLSVAHSITVADAAPAPGAITGADSVCPGMEITLSDTSASGVWLSSDITTATVSHSGILTGVMPGMDTIFYVVTNSCGSVAAFYPVVVRTDASCATAVANKVAISPDIKVFPNPAQGLCSILVASPDEEQVRLIVTNMLGEKVKEWATATNKETEVTMNLPVGVYYLSGLVSGEPIVQKIVVE